MKRILVATTVLLTGFGTYAMAEESVSCTDLLGQVNQKLQDRASELTQESVNLIIQLRNEGEAACNAGNESQADEYLEEANSKFSQ